jgi:hypothetical protein
MSKQILSALAVCGCGLSLGAQAGVEVAPNTTVGSLAFFDFGNVSNQQDTNLPKHVNVAPTGNGFDIKRLYLIVDHKFNDVWSANLTTDAQYISSPSVTVDPASTKTTTTSTTNSGGVTELFIKKLYLQAKLDDAFIVRAGAYTSPWAPFVESLYGYRWIEKGATDRLGFANTADWGLHAGGKFGASGLSYAVSAVNGGSHKNPSRTKTVDVEARVSYVPIAGLSIGIGGYTGHLGQVTVANEAFDRNTATRWDAAIGYTIAGFKVGAEYYDAKNFKTVNSITGGQYNASAVVASTATGAVPKDEASGESVWASYDFAEQFSVFARGDVSKLSKKVLPGLKDRFFLVGVGYKPIKSVDVALVYKNEKVEHGATSIGSGDANGSFTVGGSKAINDGKFSEVGLYAQWNF